MMLVPFWATVPAIPCPILTCAQKKKKQDDEKQQLVPRRANKFEKQHENSIKLVEQ